MKERRLGLSREKIQEIAIYVAFVALFIIFSVTLKDVGTGFMSTSNLMNILRQTCLIAILSVGMSFVLAAGQIDLSIGSVIGLVSLVAAIVIRDVGPGCSRASCAARSSACSTACSSPTSACPPWSQRWER